MKTIIVSCNNCGASVKLEGHKQFLTCAYCASSIKVAPPKPLDQESLIHKLQNELYKLEKEWEITKEPLVILKNNAKVKEPSSRSAEIYSILGLISLCASIGWASHLSEMIVFIGGFIITLAFLAHAAEHNSKTADYIEAKTAYEETRNRLTLELEEAKIV